MFFVNMRHKMGGALRKVCVQIQQGLTKSGFLRFQEGLRREEGDRMDPGIVSPCGSGTESEEGQPWQGGVRTEVQSMLKGLF